MTRKHPYLSLIALFSLFAIPMIIAWYLVFVGHWKGAHVNKGYLFKPSPELAGIVWKKLDGQPFLWKNNDQKWAMVYIVPLACDDECYQTIYKLHQVQIALNKDQDRFVRVLAFAYPVQPQQLQKIKSDQYAQGMLEVRVGKTALLERLGPYSGKKAMLVQGGVLVLDPQQRAVLAYPTTLKPQDLLKDLQRLMRVFHLGQSKT